MKTSVENVRVSRVSLELTSDEARILRRYIDEATTWDEWAEKNAERFNLDADMIVVLIEDLFNVLEDVD